MVNNLEIFIFIFTARQVKMRVLDLLLCWMTSASMAAVPVILDTDMDFDVDDVGALCLLHALQVLEEFNGKQSLGH